MEEVFQPDFECMRPFLRRHRVAEAWEWISSVTSPLAEEMVPLEEAAGRVLANDVVSPRNVPGFPRAMMDGYAVVAEDTLGASPQAPIVLRVIGESCPGQPPVCSVGRGEAVRIATGAPLPPGANAVLPAEWTDERGAVVFVLGSVPPQKHIAHVGEDVRAGEIIFRKGRRIRPQDLGLLSSLGLTEIAVVKSPNVRIFITGDEISPAGAPANEFCIPDANGPMLQALARRDGAIVCDKRIIPDDSESLTEAFKEPAEVVLVSGGSSVGHRDLVPGVLAKLGELVIHGVAMRPSSPAGMGRIGKKLVFLLPGNPVSCLCAYDFFAGRAIRTLSGRSPEWPYRKVSVPLRRKITSRLGRLDYVRVVLVDGEAEPLAVSGAAILSSTTRADGFLLCPEESEGLSPGTLVDVYLYDVAA